jgi:hypothetical protein
MGQGAMAQNAQMQQQPPVAAQVVQAAQGGIMQGYAGGGAVAFNRGGGVQHFSGGSNQDGVQSSPASRFLSNLMGDVRESLSGDPEADKLRQQIRAQFSREAGLLGVFRSQSDQERQRAQEIMRLLPTMDKEQMRNILGQTQRTVDPAAYQEFGPGERMEQLASAASAPLSPATPPAAAPRPPGATRPGAGTGQPQQRQQPQAATTQAQGLQNLVDLDKSREEELKAIQGRQAVDPAVAAARKAEREGAEGIASGRQTRAQSRMEEAQRLRDEAVQRAKGDIFSDPEALFRIAAGIDTRKGKSMGSLSGGIADVMGRRKADEAAARKEFQTAQSLHDQELNALDTMRQLQRERDTAIAVGDVAAARALQDQITSVNRFYQKAKEDRQTAERNYQLEVLKTQATQDQARASLISAGKPSDFEQRVRLYTEKPEQYRTMYGIDPKETSVELRALKDEQQDLHKRLESAMTDSQKKPIYEALDRIAQRRRELMGAPTAAPTGNASDPLGIRK